MKLIDGDELIELLLSTAITDKQREYSECVQSAVQKMPPVDAVPVVRCKDCLYWQKSSPFRGHTVCRYVLDCFVVRREDDFCSRGERKDGEAHD